MNRIIRSGMMPNSIHLEKLSGFSCFYSRSFQHKGSATDEMVMSRERNLSHFLGLPGFSLRNWRRHYGNRVGDDSGMSRNFLAQLWVEDRKHNIKEIRKRPKGHLNSFGGKQSSYLDHTGPVLKPPPPSQSISGSLLPTSPEEVRVATLLARSNLLITRDIEWANLVLGFEQENRYAIVDVCYPQSPAGFIREQSNVLARQLLRLRRPFVASILDAMGNEHFREVGVVHRRWHLWRRVYDLYLGDNQFAVVENPGFWNWTFTLKDIDGNVLAQIDRDWRGFGFEIFTDAGQYVIRFGSSDAGARFGAASAIQELDVARPLTLSERAVTLALAISLDNDYFSRHGGWGVPFVDVTE